MTPVVMAYGGGLDSFTMLVEGIRRGERIDVCAFVNVGDPDDPSVPGEWPGTLRHIREVAKPLAQQHGIEFVEIDANRYPIRRLGGEFRSLYGWMLAGNQIPTSSGHTCTLASKVERFEEWLADRYGDQPVEVWIGFDASEGSRVKRGEAHTGSGRVQRRNRFPLVEWNLCRCRMEELLAELKLPIPRKSACVFCPHAKAGDFKALRRDLPKMWERTLRLESAKTPTRSGFKLTLKSFSKWKISQAQISALRRLDVRLEVPPRTRRVLEERSWTTVDGLTPHGLELLRLVDDGALNAGDTIADVMIRNGLPVEQNVHYLAKPLDEWLESAGEREPGACAVCGSNRPAVKRAGCDYKSEGRLVPLRAVS